MMNHSSRATNDVRDGGRDAEFLALLGRHEPQLAACVHAMIPSWHEAEEILQQTRVALWREFGRFQSGSDFLAWARTVARYETRSHVRKGQRRIFNEALTDSLLACLSKTPEEENVRWKAFVECGRKLSVEVQELLRLVYVQNKKIRDVAKQLGRSLGGTHVTLSRVRRRLLQCMEQRLREGES